jgi:hypothetical protein
MSWALNGTVFSLKSVVGFHFKTDDSCVSPYNRVDDDDDDDDDDDGDDDDDDVDDVSLEL